ncbi:MAG: PepSY domain-containing protein [Caulobacteraceae bacterium]|nr:PepSY domain-containing protein [Caulobacteraceae bacterium]
MRSIRIPTVGLTLVLGLVLVLGAAPRLASAQAAPPAGGGQGGYDSLGADWGAQQDEARAGVRQGRYVPLARVIEEIRRRTPGQQLDAGLEQAQGRPVYRVRWAAANGRRIDYIVDARTGAILSAEGR